MKKVLILLFILLSGVLVSIDTFAQYPVNRSGVSVIDGAVVRWNPAQTYDVDELVMVGDVKLYVAHTLHVSSSAFVDDIANWTEIGAGGIIKWVTAKDYSVDDIVYDELTNKIYRVAIAHTSGLTLNDDLANLVELSKGLNTLASSTDNSIPRFDGITGDVIQESNVVIDDLDNLSGVVDVTATGDVTVKSGTNAEMVVGDTLLKVSSTGIYAPTTLEINSGDNTLFDLGPIEGQITDATLNRFTKVEYTGATGLTPVNSNGANYLLINSSGILVQQVALPTPEERRENIFLGRVITNSSVVAALVLEPTILENPANSLSDLMDSLGIFNDDGNLISANGTNLNINKSNGHIFSNGANYAVDRNDPHRVNIPVCTACSFLPILRTGVGFSAATTLDVANYDVGGVITPVGGINNESTNMRVYLFPSGNIVIAYGQDTYNNPTQAQARISRETFVKNPLLNGGVLVAIISVAKNATDLSDSDQAKFTYLSQFGDIAAGSGGGSTTFQESYNNSAPPQIVLNDVIGSLQVLDASTPISSPLLQIQSNDTLSKYFEVAVSGNTSTSLDVNGKLVVTSTDDASVPCPIMTTAQRILLTPSLGECIFNSTSISIEYYDGTGWTNVKPNGIPTMSKGSLFASSGAINGEFTACADGQILVWDSAETAGIKCGAATPLLAKGELAIGDGSVNSTISCADDEYLVWDSTEDDGAKCVPIATDTNAGTICSSGEYLDGDGTCNPAAAVSNSCVHTTNTSTVNGNSSVTASCTGGRVVTGGGCNLPSNDTYVTGSYPSSTTAWTCRYGYDIAGSAGSRSLTAYAICCN